MSRDKELDRLATRLASAPLPTVTTWADAIHGCLTKLAALDPTAPSAHSVTLLEPHAWADQLRVLARADAIDEPAAAALLTELRRALA